MGYNKFIYAEVNFKFLTKDGFNSKIIKIIDLIIALKYAHIARRSYY